VKCILRYLRGTVSHGLHITRSSSFTFHGFIDAIWVGSVEDRKSTGGLPCVLWSYADFVEIW